MAKKRTNFDSSQWFSELGDLGSVSASNLCFNLPKSLRNMPKVVRSAAREVILSVKRFCEQEKRNNGPIIPFQHVIARTAALTGKMLPVKSNMFYPKLRKN